MRMFSLVAARGLLFLLELAGMEEGSYGPIVVGSCEVVGLRWLTAVL